MVTNHFKIYSKFLKILLLIVNCTDHRLQQFYQIINRQLQSIIMTQNNSHFVKFSSKAYLLNPQAVDLFDLNSSISGSVCSNEQKSETQIQLHIKQVPEISKRIEFDDQFFPQCIKKDTQKQCLANTTKTEEDQLANKLQQVMMHINEETIGIQSTYKQQLQKLKSTLGSKEKLLESQTSKLNSFRCENQLLRNQVARLKEENNTLKQKCDQLLKKHQEEQQIKKQWGAKTHKKSKDNSKRKNKINVNSNPLYLSQLTKQSKQQQDNQPQSFKYVLQDLVQDKVIIESHIEKFNNFSRYSDNISDLRVQSFSQTIDERQTNKNMIESQICQISNIAKKKEDSSFQDNLSWLKFVKNEVSQTNFSEYDNCFDDRMKKKIEEYIYQIRKDFNLKKSQVKASSKHKRKISTLKNFNK